MRNAYFRRPVPVSVLLVLTAVAPAFAANTRRQNPPIQLGTSGGSVNASSSSTCCAGTLGSLVSRDGVLYILSNNHVLARSTPVGTNIIQPGLADNNCSTNHVNTVATFQGDFVPLGNNVDAAVARVISGQVQTSGAILGLGTPCSSTAVPSVGLPVIKAGRTTGTTIGVVQAIDLSATVQYVTQCGSTTTFTESYTNQIAITPPTFSNGGDSGSLILTNTSTNNRHPVGLLFAGNADVTIANPISDVVAAFQAGGHTFSFVGKTCATAIVSPDRLLTGPSLAEVEHTRWIKKDHESELFAQNGVIGVGVGRMSDREDETEAAIIVYVKSNGGVSLPRGLKIPQEIDGVKVRVILSDPFIAR
ncbi:MAG TPA: hypothetical protein VF173_38435 [Thermoanaerobaculia bacterium]|nr:hypothetical protein [Thermoanaerobaculia bacterium]